MVWVAHHQVVEGASLVVEVAHALLAFSVAIVRSQGTPRLIVKEDARHGSFFFDWDSSFSFESPFLCAGYCRT
jgi:hypothetical protein